MSDVDDELLALAGGDASSDEDEVSRKSSRRQTRSPPPARASGVKGVATKKTSATSGRDREDSEQSEEEGEAESAPGSPSSLQSAPMDESDSDDDEVTPSKARPGDDDENKYPIEGLFMSLAERAEIMNMREFEREQILAERAQEKDRIHQNKLLRQLVSNEEQRNKKRSASAADLEDGQRKTARARTKLGGTKVGETSSGIDTLKSRRAEKTERTRRREEDRERRKDRSDSYDEFRDDGGDSDVEWAQQPRSRSPEMKAAPPADLPDVERVRFSRSRFGQVAFWPGLAETVKGCFVRISIGPDPDTRENVYRMAVVKGLATNKPYAFTGPQGTEIVSDQYVIAAHGKAQREWPFITCSDSHFTESEWNRYRKVCDAEGVALPKKPDLLAKADGINRLINRNWTAAEINEKLERQQELKNLFNGVTKRKLENEMEDARKIGDLARAVELQDKLDSFGIPRLAFRTSLPSEAEKKVATINAQQARLAQVNMENRRRNEDAVRRAQLKERAKAREIEKKMERGEFIENEDHSRRLKTRAKFVHDVNELHERASSQNASGASTPANGTPRLGSQKQSLLPHLVKLQQLKSTDTKGMPTIHKPLMDDDVIGALDLDIDENIVI